MVDPRPRTAGGSGQSGRGRKRARLSRSAEFQRVYRQGRSHANRYFVLYAFPRSDGDAGPRLGVSVSRKVGGAVVRARAKRLLREAFWAETTRLAGGHDYVVVARPDARGLGEREGLEGIRTALVELLDRHGGASERRTDDAEDAAR